MGIDVKDLKQNDEEDKDKDEGEKEGSGEVFWIIDSIFVPAALIDDAIVILKDELGDSIIFTFVEFEFIDYDTTLYDTSYFEFGGNIFTMIDTFEIDTTISRRVNIYKDTTGQFNPQPNTHYTLSINASGYDAVRGNLLTPDFPIIKNTSYWTTTTPSWSIVTNFYRFKIQIIFWW